MNKSKLIILAACASIAITGCDKSPDELKYAHEEEMLHSQQQHELDMARLQNQSSVSYQGSNDIYQQQVASQDQNQQLLSQPQQVLAQPQDSGFGGGSLALAAIAGAGVGMLAGNMLDNGMRSYTDDHGHYHYYDKHNKPISKDSYMLYKKSHPRVSKFKQHVANTKNLVAQKTKAAVARVKKSEKLKYARKLSRVKTKQLKRAIKRRLRKHR